MRKHILRIALGLITLGLFSFSTVPAYAGGEPVTIADIAGTWAMSTRTAPFQLSLFIDATNHVAGSFTASPGFVGAGTLHGRLVSKYIVFTLIQANGARGDGVLEIIPIRTTAGFGYQLVGPVKLDDDSRPIDNWSSTKKLSSHGFATAKNDVDIYNGPGGNFRVVGMMRRGATAPVIEHHPDGWCKLQGVLSGGDGWVADDHLSACR